MEQLLHCQLMQGQTKRTTHCQLGLHQFPYHVNDAKPQTRNLNEMSPRGLVHEMLCMCPCAVDDGGNELFPHNPD